MSLLSSWCGFIGAWVLVAGPIYQGALEMSEMAGDRRIIEAQAQSVPPPLRISPWWWLLPPVAYVKTRHAQEVWRQQMLLVLTPAQRAEFVNYLNKATGWWLVSLGAALIGVKEASELVEAYEWPQWVTVPIVMLAGVSALTFTVRRLHQTLKGEREQRR